MKDRALKFDIMRGYRAEIMLASSAINILSLALPITILQVYDRIIPNEANSTLAIFAVALGVILIADLFLSLGRSYITTWTSARVQHRLACQGVEHLFRSDLRAFDSEPPGIHIQRIRSIDSIKAHYAGQGLLLAVDVPFAILFFVLIGLIAGPLAAVPIVIFVVLSFAANTAGKRLGEAHEERSKTDDQRYNFMIEVLKNIYTVKGLGLESMMIRRYERLQGSSAEASYRVADSNTWGSNAGQISSQLTAIAVGAFGSTLVMDGTLTIGGLAACTLLAGRSAQPMMRAVNAWTQHQNAQVKRRQIQELMAIPLESKPGAPAIHKIEGNVALDNVSFSYSTEDSALFRNVNIQLNAGETVAIRGANGSGKSTMLGLMMGLHVPTSGAVLIDGQDAWDFDPVSLRAQVIYLPQQPALFQGSLLENLTMFRGDAYVDAALRMADRLGLHEAVGRMPNGYETRVEHAANDGLPGGVRQRIALVRALTLVEDPRFILFDEANSFLDQESDARLLEVLREYRGSCTMVIVSHRPSYLELAERLYVIQNQGLEEAPEGVRDSFERLQREFA